MRVVIESTLEHSPGSFGRGYWDFMVRTRVHGVGQRIIGRLNSSLPIGMTPDDNY